MSCRDNCKCKSIKREEVDIPYDKQLKFAVPEEGLNEIGLLDEIEEEILDVINHRIRLNEVRGFGVIQLGYSIRDDVEDIFKKYRER